MAERNGITNPIPVRLVTFIASSTLVISSGIVVASGAAQVWAQLRGESHNITATNELFGIQTYIQEMLTIPLPGGVKPEEIALQVSDGGPAQVTNEVQGYTQYYNLVNLEPTTRDGFFEVTNDDSGKFFPEDRPYSANEISKNIRTQTKLAWVNVQYKIPDSALFEPTPDDSRSAIENALNEVVKNNYIYDGPRISLNDRLKMVNINCKYSNGEYGTIEYCIYNFVNAKTGEKFGLSVENSNYSKSARVEFSLENQTLVDSRIQDPSVDFDPETVKKFINGLNLSSR